MLTRFKVSGFKNLVDVDIRFGPFMCIAGANAVGKSNLFDAILFLSALADKPFKEAVKSVRGNSGSPADIRSLFHRYGDNTDSKIVFEAEMIVPKEGIDDLGQKIEASNTFLRYSLELAYNADKGSIELFKEELTRIRHVGASKHLLFSHNKAWRVSIIKGDNHRPLISTDIIEDVSIIHTYLDHSIVGGSMIHADTLPRTVLSTASAMPNMFALTPQTAIMAKREMQSWRLLLLDPLALRKPDNYNAPTQLGADGSHLPATLYHLSKANGNDESRIYQQITNRLSELIEGVYGIGVDKDEKRELFTLELTDRNGTKFSARDLSDGTLRFLAAAVIEADTNMNGLICIEEPENGIHPARIPSMIKLLRDIATDPELPVEEGNPLRQVIVNTHSPAVVAQVPNDSLIVAELREMIRDTKRFKAARFIGLSDTWRTKDQPNIRPVNLGTLLSYLYPVPYHDKSEKGRVIDRKDLQPYLPFQSED